MDRGAWQATVYGVTKIWRYWVTKTLTFHKTILITCKMKFLFNIMWISVNYYFYYNNTSSLDEKVEGRTNRTSIWYCSAVSKWIIHKHLSEISKVTELFWNNRVQILRLRWLYVLWNLFPFPRGHRAKLYLYHMGSCDWVLTNRTGVERYTSIADGSCEEEGVSSL